MTGYPFASFVLCGKELLELSRHLQIFEQVSIRRESSYVADRNSLPVWIWNLRSDGPDLEDGPHVE